MARIFMGVVHLPALPSAAGGSAGFEDCLEAGLRDARALAEGGVDAILIENFGDRPFRKGTAADPVAPDVVAGLAIAARAVRAESGLPVAVNCLRNDGVAALGAAACAGADWVRINVLSGTYATDQGLIEGEAARVLGYRRQLGADRIRILADHLVKHASPLGMEDPLAAARDLVERGGADGVIVSGARTGEAVDSEELAALRGALGEGQSLWIGSGLNVENAAQLWPLCDGAIVGTSLKQDGRVDRPVDPVRVAALRKILVS